MFFDDLEDLPNIIDEIYIDDKVSLLEKYKDEITDTILHLMEEYINDNPLAITEEDFHEEFVESIIELLLCQYNNDSTNEYDDIFEEKLEELVEETSEIFYSYFIPDRSFENTFILKTNSENDKQYIQKQLELLKNKPQPEQRTSQWYIFRHNLITASNAYKVFESENTRNQLIFEKCQPLQMQDKVSFTNINTPFHWGQKYEPVSVMVYEDKYKTKVGDFGCIQHDTYPFLGASPDGINIDSSSNLFGRMLEIKNVVNRIIDGIPKKEYWIQMQLQMETCNFNECDFLETKFVEYQDSEDCSAFQKFSQDGIFNKSKDDKLKGVILYFVKKDGNPIYIYCPLNIIDYDSFTKWEEKMMEFYQNDENQLIWLKNIYWKMQQMSCVLTLRNKEWFNNNVHKIKETWEIIEKERITGYMHRAPNKRIKKDIQTKELSSGCLISLKKKDNTPEPLSIINIRTQSFDEVKKNIT